MSANNENESMVIYLNGHIDKDNAGETEESILEMLTNNEHTTLTIDMSGVDFVSEEGLEALKKIGSRSKNVELTNVTDDIYEIFEKKGITSIMPVYQLRIQPASE